MEYADLCATRCATELYIMQKLLFVLTSQILKVVDFTNNF